jgi:hypothetical protein
MPDFITLDWCPDGWRSAYDHCYKLVDGNFNWQEANDYCTSLYPQSHVLVVNTNDEQLSLSQLAYYSK